MPKFLISWDFDGTEYCEEIECESLEEAEQQAADQLRDMIYTRTSSSAELLPE